jgi:hypothetical protein
LFIDDELGKALQNPKWNGLFFEPLRGRELSKNKVQSLDLASWLWSTLKGLPFIKKVYSSSTLVWATMNELELDCLSFEQIIHILINGLKMM